MEEITAQSCTDCMHGEVCESQNGICNKFRDRRHYRYLPCTEGDKVFEVSALGVEERSVKHIEINIFTETTLVPLKNFDVTLHKKREDALSAYDRQRAWRMDELKKARNMTGVKFKKK